MPRRKRSHKIASFVAFLILFAAAGIIGYLVYQSYFANQPAKPSATTQVDPTPTQPTETPAEPAPTETPAEDIKTPVKYEGENPNQKSTITGAITYASKNGNKLTIRVNIDQYLTTGNCNLVLSQDGADVYGASANLIDSASTSTCEGFDVPATNLSGKYLVTINLVSGNKAGQITKEISL